MLLRWPVLLLLGLAACSSRRRGTAYRPLGDDAAALRASFNADVGKERLLLLLAPS
jgi:hypothetical protein